MDDDALFPSRIFPSLRMGRYRFELEPEGPMHLPAYQGSTWRGVIGNALLDLVCPWDSKDCGRCSHSASCAYHYLYEAGIEEKGFADLPRPYIFSPTDQNGPNLYVDVTLIGQAGRFLPYLVAAWVRAGERGVGKGRGRFSLRSVYALPPNGSLKPIYDDGRLLTHEELTLPLAAYLNSHIPDPPWQIIIESPLRLRRDGRNAGRLHWENAFRSLAIRLSVLSQSYCGGTRPEKELWRRLTEFLSSPLKTEVRTKWFDWKRFSSTQDTHVPMGGFIGESTVFPSEDSCTWWRWWEAASLFHLGKGTSMGLGKISINDHRGGCNCR